LLLLGDIATISIDFDKFLKKICAYFPNNKLDFSALFNPGLCGGWLSLGYGAFLLRRMNP
jgi:hypothetical protein